MKESDRILAQLLDECADLLLQGESLAACLARYPEHATSLAPLLQSIAGVREMGTVPSRPAHAAAASRARFVTAAMQTRRAMAPRQAQTAGGPSPAFAAWPGRLQTVFAALRPLPGGLIATLLLVLVVGILATGVVTTSANALPGDRLYNVKLVREQAQRLLTLDPASREALDEQIVNERVTEATTIQHMGRAVDNMPLAGSLEAFSETEWTVSGVVVALTPETTIVGQPVLGGVVRGQVRAPGDGALIALYLRVDSPPAPRLPAGYNVVTVTPSRPVVTVTRAPTRRPFTYPALPPTVRPRRTAPPAVIVTPVPTRTPVPVATVTPAPVVTVAPATQPPATAAPSGTATALATSVAAPTSSPQPASPAPPATATQPVTTPAPPTGTAPVPPTATTPAPPTATAPSIVQFSGIIQAIGADNWMVAGRVVYLSAATLISGATPAAGALADIWANQAADGRLIAQQIIVHAAPVASATPTPGAPANTATSAPVPPTDVPAAATNTPAAPAPTLPAPTNAPVPPANTPAPPANTALPPPITPVATP